MRRLYGAMAIVAAVTLTGAVIGARGENGKDDEKDSQGRGRKRGCSLSTLRGDYGIQIQGMRPSGPGAPLESVIGVVIRTYDGRGNFEQIDNVHGSLSAFVPDRAGYGTYVVNEDCTGVAYAVLPGPPFQLEERFVIVDNGLEMRSATANPPPVMVTGVHRKISHD